jgi:hypothetical protein
MTGVSEAPVIFYLPLFDIIRQSPYTYDIEQ